MSRQQKSPGVDELRAKLFGGPAVTQQEKPHDPLVEGTFVGRDVIEMAEERMGRVNATLQAALQEIRESKEKRILSPQELRAGIDLLFQKHNFHPVEELIKLAMTGSLETKELITVLKELASFVVPKVRSVEVSGEVKHNHSVEIVRFGPNGQVTDRSPLVQRVTETGENPIDVEVVK